MLKYTLINAFPEILELEAGNVELPSSMEIQTILLGLVLNTQYMMPGGFCIKPTWSRVSNK
tara:strand:- start:14976 stop:15158 length:183 start_codon:yes stop_codon:yes gene_type:complete